MAYRISIIGGGSSTFTPQLALAKIKALMDELFEVEAEYLPQF